MLFCTSTLGIFLKKRDRITPQVIEPIWGFSNKFILPGDLVRLISTNIQDDPLDRGWVIEGNYLLADVKTLDILYIANVDESLFPGGPSEVLAYKLALDLSYSLADSNTSFRRELKSEYLKLLSVNRSYNSQENGRNRQTIDGGSFIGARHSGFSDF